MEQFRRFSSKSNNRQLWLVGCAWVEDHSCLGSLNISTLWCSNDLSNLFSKCMVTNQKVKYTQHSHTLIESTAVIVIKSHHHLRYERILRNILQCSSIRYIAFVSFFFTCAIHIHTYRQNTNVLWRFLFNNIFIFKFPLLRSHSVRSLCILVTILNYTIRMIFKI